jgi:hypothetical protein
VYLITAPSIPRLEKAIANIATDKTKLYIPKFSGLSILARMMVRDKPEMLPTTKAEELYNAFLATFLATSTFHTS